MELLLRLKNWKERKRQTRIQTLINRIPGGTLRGGKTRIRPGEVVVEAGVEIAAVRGSGSDQGVVQGVEISVIATREGVVGQVRVLLDNGCWRI